MQSRPDTPQHSTLKLFEIENRISDALLFREGEEDLTEEQEDELSAEIEQLDLAFDRKIESCAAVTENLKHEIVALEEVRDSFNARIKSLKKNRSWLMRYMKIVLQKLRITHAGTGKLRVRIQKNPLSVEVPDVDKIPEEFWKVKIEPNKEAIIRHVKNTGENPEGVIPVYGSHLRVY